MPMTDDEKKRFVQKAVRESIKEVDGGSVTVTQDTSLGTTGLGHGCDLRKKYFPKIQQRLNQVSARMNNLAPQRFCDADVVRVRNVSKLVLDSLEFV